MHRPGIQVYTARQKQADRQAVRKTDRQTDRQTDVESQSHLVISSRGLSSITFNCKKKNQKANAQTGIQVDTTGQKTGRQAVKQTDIQTLEVNLTK
jgi:hypothetical protein